MQLVKGGITVKREMRGYTLTELIIAIAVIGVLAAVLIPAMSFVVSKAVFTSAMSDAYNTALDYELSSDNKTNALIFVQKSGKFYIFAYYGGELKTAGNRGYDGYSESFGELTDRYNYCENDYSDLLNMVNSGELTYDEAFGECFFRMSGASGLVLLDSNVHNFEDLSSELSNPLDNVLIYKGIILGEPERRADPADDTGIVLASFMYRIDYYNGENYVYRTFHGGHEGETVSLYSPVASTAPEVMNGRIINHPQGFPDYDFIGWSESPDAETGFHTIVLGRIHNITLYAVWQQRQG